METARASWFVRPAAMEAAFQSVTLLALVLAAAAVVVVVVVGVVVVVAPGRLADGVNRGHAADGDVSAAPN